VSTNSVPPGGKQYGMLSNKMIYRIGRKDKNLYESVQIMSWNGASWIPANAEWSCKEFVFYCLLVTVNECFSFSTFPFLPHSLNACLQEAPRLLGI